MGTAVSACAAAFALRPLQAASLHLPIGLELYTVRDLLTRDFEGTLRQMAKIGFREVEFASFMGRTPAQIRAALQEAGLGCVSAHYTAQELQTALSQKIDEANAIGLRYMVCGFPWVANPQRFHIAPGDRGGMVRALWNDLTLDDWRWNADLFNHFGEQTRKAGIQFCYHNNNYEFRRYGAANHSTTGYDELVRRTDPALVKFELDCGWAVRAGSDPEAIMQRSPGRFPLLHAKDIRKGASPSTAMGVDAVVGLGHGSIDWPRIFAAAPAAGVQHCFLDQEIFRSPILDGLKADYAWLHQHLA
jgi:sugar phosphate isomerase/epimerase